jgi:hypothetical protein
MVASTIVPVVIRPLGLQVQVHRPQDLFPQLVFFQQVPELRTVVSSVRSRLAVIKA